MKTGVIFLVLIVLYSSGCKSAERKAERNKRMANISWVNPAIIPVNHPGITGISTNRGEPEITDGLKKGLNDFCQRINEKFSESGLSRAEADSIYTRLFLSGMIKNEATEMPDPDNPMPAESLEDFKSRVALMANPDGGYFIFYRKSGCGFTYFYGTLNIDTGNGAINIKPVEVWRAIVPC